MCLPVICFSNYGTFTLIQLYCISETSCFSTDACTFHLMVPLSVEKGRENKVQETVFQRQISARPDAFIYAFRYVCIYMVKKK